MRHDSKAAKADVCRWMWPLNCQSVKEIARDVGNHVVKIGIGKKPCGNRRTLLRPPRRALWSRRLRPFRGALKRMLQESLEWRVYLPDTDVANTHLHLFTNIRSNVSSATSCQLATSFPAGQAAGAKPQTLGHGVAGEALLQAELHGISLLLRRKPASGSGGVGHRWTV
jgi:hypothetical protein